MEYLAVTALASDQNLIVNELMQLASKHQCNIEDCSVNLLGAEYGIIMLIAGNWSSIAKLESALTALTDKFEIAIAVKRTGRLKFQDNLLPYLIQVVALDNPGLAFDISNFFSAQNIFLNDMQTHPFKASYTDTQMTTLILSISVPADINVADLRERFMLLCDELNIDGIMEPEKR